MSDSPSGSPSVHPRIVSTATAHPPHHYSQAAILDFAREQLLGAGWQRRPEAAQRARQMERIFTTSRVDERQVVIDIDHYYARPRTTGERMETYGTAAYALGREALAHCLADAGDGAAGDITDLSVVSCTGYAAPGLDILLARDLGLRPDARRVVVGHMGCFGALVGLRQALATLRAYPQARMALLSVELSSLHFASTLAPDALAPLALFGDAAAAVMLANDPTARGPELVDTYCVADFASADQMTWTIADAGFVMGLSPRVPITLRRQVRGAVERLLAPHGLGIHDITHWLVHPGGPSILEAIGTQLELCEEQLAASWQVLREHGNCSSTTVLLVLDALLRAGRTQAGEWGVMMAFGPGLTLETCLLRF